MEWEAETTVAQWTKKLIHDVGVWYNCKHRSCGYFITQALSDHGAFRNYLHSIKRDKTKECQYYGQCDDVNHTLFGCDRWHVQPIDAENALGYRITADNIIDTMIESEKKWKIVDRLIVDIMRRTEQKERIRQGREKNLVGHVGDD